MTAYKKAWFVLLLNALLVLPSFASLQKNESQTFLFKNLPKVALLVKEQYVDPQRIKPDAMLASILESLELKITKLVITLPKSLEAALEQVKATKKDELAKDEKKEEVKVDKGPEKLILDLGGTTKSFDYEPQRSIWGMIFFLRDVFKFVEAEANKQGLTDSKLGDDAIDWEKIEANAINGMLGTLDPHSIYVEPKYARDLNLTIKGEFGGIGIVISVRDGFLTVISAIDGTPAFAAGVKAKDRIIKIDDDSAINMDLNDAVNLLRGKPNTPVRITVQRSGSAKEFEYVLKRAIIKVDSVAYALLDNNIGYLRVKAFQGNTAADVKNAILAMKKTSKEKMNGLILDLRGNPGGLLREAVEISDLFLDGKEVVSTQGARPESKQVEMAASGELDPNLKIAVLVDVGSASASEIVAGALKNDRAIIIGDRTFGKGSVQVLFDFPTEAKEVKESSKKPAPVEPAALKLTIAEYFAPNHTSMQNIGVTPHIQLSPVHAFKAEEISIFPEDNQREVDLEGHLAPVLADAKMVESLANLEYLAPKPDEEGGEYGKLDLKKLKGDFFVEVASEFIKESNGSNLKDLLANTDNIKNKFSLKEHKKIEDALKKYNVDWSAGPAVKNASIKATVTSNPGASAGNKMKVSVKVKNNSKEPLYQLHALTHAKTDLFNLKEFLFGKVKPGQEVEKSVEFEIPKDVVTRKDLMTLEFRDIKREKIDEMVVPLEINGLGRPRLAHRVFIDDSALGNGTGSIQQNEDVELTVWLKNVGDGRAYEPMVLLRNESGSAVFLKNGRWQSGELLPNQETSMKFSFRVKEPIDQAKFELQIFDGKMHDLWRDKIVLNVGEKKKATAIKRTVVVKEGMANLYAKPSDQEKIASVKTGLNLSAIRESGDYLQVIVDKNLSGFIKKSEVKDAPKEKVAKTLKKSDFYSINYNRMPPRVSLKFGDGSGWSKVSSGAVEAKIDNDDKVSDVLLYVNGKKVLYRELKNNNKKKIEFKINLKPGVNSISLFAREDASYGQRESITVFYDSDGKAMGAIKNTGVKAAEK